MPFFSEEKIYIAPCAKKGKKEKTAKKRGAMSSPNPKPRRERAANILRAIRPRLERVRESARGISASQGALLGTGVLGLSLLAIALLRSRQNKSMQLMETRDILDLYKRASSNANFGSWIAAESKSLVPDKSVAGTTNNTPQVAKPTKEDIAAFCVSRVHDLRRLVSSKDKKYEAPAREILALILAQKRKENTRDSGITNSAVVAQIAFLENIVGQTPHSEQLAWGMSKAPPEHAPLLAQGYSQQGASRWSLSSPETTSLLGSETEMRSLGTLLISAEPAIPQKVSGKLRQVIQKTNIHGIHPAYGHIATWDVGDATDMSKAFYNTSIGAACIADLSFWDTRKVKTMKGMFGLAKEFNGKIGTWHTMSVLDMSEMFHYATEFNQPIGDWDTRNVVTMNHAFSYANKFDQDVGRWNTKNVETMRSMFYGAKSFNCGGSAMVWDVRKVKDMTFMFSLALEFNRDISAWKRPARCDIRNMFSYSTPFAKGEHADSLKKAWNLTPNEAHEAGFRRLSFGAPAKRAFV